MAKVDLSGRPLSAPTLRRIIDDLGLKRFRSSGRIEVKDCGEVLVKNTRRGHAFSDKIDSTADLTKLRKAITDGIPSSRERVESSSLQLIVDRARSIHKEQRVNSRELGGGIYGTDLPSKYMAGKKFDVPLFEAKPKDAEILAVDSFPAIAAIRSFFERGDNIAVPVHPAEVKFLAKDRKASNKTVAACASSERTLHLYEPSLPPFLLKLPMPNIEHFNFHRPISKVDAESALDKTRLLKEFADRSRRKNDPFCFLPEAMAIVDKKSDQASIIRLATPYPPPEDPKNTWLMPAYSLYGTDEDRKGAKPTVVEMMEHQAKKKDGKAPLDYLYEDLLGPLVKSAMRVYLDLGASAPTHGQNIFLEIGPDGQPTGRACHADVEGIWPHPAVDKKQGKLNFYERYDYEHGNPGRVYNRYYRRKDKISLHIENTFDTYFLYGLIAPILRAVQRHYPALSSEIESRLDKLFISEFRKRADIINEFDGRNEPYEFFAKVLNGKASFKGKLDDARVRFEEKEKLLKKKNRPKRTNFRLT